LKNSRPGGHRAPADLVGVDLEVKSRGSRLAADNNGDACRELKRRARIPGAALFS